ncbi:hypothetical protein D3C72_1690520 [compost metagenome]
MRAYRGVGAQQLADAAGAGEAATAIGDLRLADGQAAALQLDPHRHAGAIGAVDGAVARGGLVDQRPAGQVVAQLAIKIATGLRGRGQGGSGQRQQQGKRLGIHRQHVHIGRNVGESSSARVHVGCRRAR